ncbi:chemotaxis regulatory protein ChePep-like [Drosophila kikkawai]|uniref:Chemotaxis regulatory protein ChePep-like n=1 Tax=Drosophila kikkawai TaxID=30033 RepID=A0A6P4J083_DROKI|nr:uncharacterized protein LOC108079142 [Drosophila kikkawai]
MYIITLKTLSEKQRNEVLEWLRENKADSVQVRRKFSDVYPLAELLQPDFPRLIDLVNYPKRNGINLKIQNWETFNFKVLSKFNTMLGKEFIEELAKGNQCAVGILIYEMLRLRKQQVSKRQEQNAASEKEKEVEVEQQEEIKTKEDEEITVVDQNEELKENKEVEVVEQHEVPKTLELNEDPMTLEQNQEEALTEASDTVDTLDKGQVTSRMILYVRYQELSRECQAKWSMIRMYENHVIHLETLLQSREKEIEEMRQVIRGLQGTPL